jgi:pyruvate dehydrogenase E1 component
LGGYLPKRQRLAKPLAIPALSAFDGFLKGGGEREMSTTMAFVRILTQLTRDKSVKDHIVPIIPDEARTFGMEGMFRQLGIYASAGQLYEPQDADQLMYYKESKDGQILEEGINEAGAFSSWLAAGTAYSNHSINMIPFYVYYSMFGFQRIGDLAWAAGDIRARGFLVGGTAGRTTLSGEGLQHQDGHSLLTAGTIPVCVSYDPTFMYELAVIIHNGLERMYQQQENIFYYLTIMNENYLQPAMPEGVKDGIIKGLYLYKANDTHALKVQLMGSGTILREAIAAADLLAKDFNVSANIWSATSFNELAREAQAVERWNRLHPESEQKQPYVSQCFRLHPTPVIAATDYVRAYPEQIRRFIPQNYTVLGTDGFGRSDTRSQLRQFFEVDRYHIAVAALKALADEGNTPPSQVSAAIQKYTINPEKPNPVTV